MQIGEETKIVEVPVRAPQPAPQKVEAAPDERPIPIEDVPLFAPVKAPEKVKADA